MELFKQACEIYAKKELDFKDIFIEYSKFGYVYATPECIVLAHIETQDTWFVQFAIGENCLVRIHQMMPFRLPYVSWMRGLRDNSKVKKYKLENIERLINYGRPKSSCTT